MNIISGWFSSIVRILSGVDWLNLYIVLSIQITFIFGVLWLFRKPLGKIASTKYMLRILCSHFVLFTLSRPAYWDLFDLRGLYEMLFDLEIEPLIRICIPPKITSQISEISSTHAFDWLGVCTFLWLLIAIIHRGPNDKSEKLTCALINQKYHLDCPARIRAILDGVLASDERWQRHCTHYDDDVELKLVWIRVLRSPCTFHTNTRKPVIAVDRIDYTDEEFENIFRHELAHITLKHERMLDRLETLRRFCWFNPVLHILQKWIHQQVEIDSDDIAVNHKDVTAKERASYARLLVSLAEEKHLSGAVLHISAGAQFIRQRVEGVLNPHSHRLSLPVTILLIILSLHLSLVIAPGESPQSRFLNAESLLACMGNKYDYIARGLDPAYKNRSKTWFDDGDWYITIEETSNKTSFRFRGTAEAYTEAENEAAERYVSDWVADFTGLLGEPTVEFQDSRIDTIFGFVTPENRYTYRWPITISGEAKARLWEAPPENACLSLTWTCEYIENSTNGITGEPIPPHYYHQIYISPAKAD